MGSVLPALLPPPPLPLLLLLLALAANAELAVAGSSSPPPPATDEIITHQVLGHGGRDGVSRAAG